MSDVLDGFTMMSLYKTFDRLDEVSRDAALRALTLKYGPAPYAAGSSTSAHAAKKIRPGRGPMHQRILRLIELNGPMTDERLEACTGYKHQTCSARRRELVIAGRLKAVGEVKVGRFVHTLWGLA